MRKKPRKVGHPKWLLMRPLLKMGQQMKTPRYWRWKDSKENPVQDPKAKSDQGPDLAVRSGRGQEKKSGSREVDHVIESDPGKCEKNHGLTN